MKKRFIIIGFLLLGLIFGFISVWFNQNTDNIFFFNIPGTLLGNAIYTGSIKLIGDPHSAEAHFTIPWILRVPQVYVLSSVIFWGLVGMLLTMLLKPKVVAWVMGIYLAVFVAFTALSIFL